MTGTVYITCDTCGTDVQKRDAIANEWMTLHYNLRRTERLSGGEGALTLDFCSPICAGRWLCAQGTTLLGEGVDS